MVLELKNIEKCNQYDEINRVFVETVLNKAQEDENNVIIAAWGGSQKDNKIAKEVLKEKYFLRVSKSVILNLMKVKTIKPALNGRYSAMLQNNEEIIISRKYVAELKRALKGELF